jgi:putative methionine-R-sulfoxide reductase with GAF domain
MNIFYSIKHKLRFAFFILILITGLGSMYSFYLMQRSKDYLQWREQVVSILMHLKEARIIEKNFILFGRMDTDFLENGSSALLINHQEEVSSINRNIDQILHQTIGGEIVIYSQLVALRNGVAEYNKQFQELKTLYHKRGFKDYGLEGSMREHVHALQDCKSNDEKVFAYSLRRHEKDFMLRKDLKYLEALEETARQFKDHVENANAAHLTAGYKNQTHTVIDNYVAKFREIVALEQEIGLHEADGILGKLNETAASLSPISDELFTYVDLQSNRTQSRAIAVFVGSIMTTLAAGLIISVFLDKRLSKPIMLLNKVMQDEIEGKPRNGALDKIKSKDEIGMLTANFKQMIMQLENQMSLITEKNKSLELSSREDNKRKWVAEGVSAFLDHMKHSNTSLSEIGYTLISGIVKYINANQGGIFFIDDLENPQKMILYASYAYDRRKYYEKEIHSGEGLVGAVWNEKETMILKDIPQEYIAISSGLGEARPHHLIIVPIKNEDKVYGVMEIASFHAFKTHHIELIQRTGERMATNFQTLKTQQRTTELLKTAQMQAEELRAQEEEMRQNMEELTATQEDFVRREAELKSIIEQLKSENDTLHRNKLPSEIGSMA